MTSDRFKEMVEFAILREQEAVDFYTAMADNVSETHIKNVLRDFASQERGHKAKLQSILDGKNPTLVHKDVADLKIADYVVDVEPTQDLSFQGALIIAMKKEKAAYRLYSDMATACDDPVVRDLFLWLANEEASHKLKFEILYDDLIFREN
ncbi:MAG TPA: ferritin family protein [Polyangiaceae bacterium]|jgi:rubrerythrin|nr:MAG: Rubrerythrin [Deltaproteobacteria bacterium ADurb.Bin207]HNS95465.1 ferritin family protein [Polyangiaceae bacterium]HNZ20595.1 ferritin family protein [Polyangiaceae bacterium]HOD20789.1 ferritin family protein [Polyangiaceae bacterium]HOE47209.1 ferritin family protein [Polyangiaceae bacterium]